MIKITLETGFSHLLESPESIESYSTSPNTRAALQTAYDRGDWQPYTPPEPEPETPQEDWSNFRLALMGSPTFRAWGKELPADWREDLKLAALAANLEALQSVYAHLAALYPPSEAAVEEWQQLANDSHIPLTF